MRYQLQQTQYPPYRLELHDTHDPRTRPVYVDFVAGKARHRLNYGGGKGQGIAKAIGLHKLKQPSVIDATAGLGRESFVLASLGCRVTLLERNELVHALLADGLLRAEQSGDEAVQEIIARMTLVAADALAWLATIAEDEQPEVIYLDPMFPQRRKSALVQKEMRFFHEVVGEDVDGGELLAVARRVALKRVVVKRPAGASELAGVKPGFVIRGKTTRYDVYLPG